MTYQISDIEKMLENTTDNEPIPSGDFKQIVRQLIRERNAYREGWADLLMSEFQISMTQTKEDFLNEVDAEAQRIIGEGK